MGDDMFFPFPGEIGNCLKGIRIPDQSSRRQIDITVLPVFSVFLPAHPRCPVLRPVRFLAVKVKQGAFPRVHS
jgi:hypothetical protein